MSIDTIKNKRILFFCPSFFNYEQAIAAKMREMGAYVDLYDARAVSSPFSKALLKISPAFFTRRSQKYYDAILKENCSKEYDFILIIKCDMTPLSVLKKLKTLYPKAKLCLYLWDSINNIPGIKRKLPFFDVVHSFDLNDCNHYSNLIFRPLFYLDQYKKESDYKKDHSYDICFIGTVHSDRYAIIKSVQSVAEALHLKCYWFLYLQSKFAFIFYKLTSRSFRGSKKTDFSFKKMSSNEIADIIDDAKAVLDIQHPNQSGLTMRTIEMIGMEKKLITTNHTIKQYDFYNPKNIAVVDRKNVVIDPMFFKDEYVSLTPEVYKKYSIDKWVMDVLNG